MRARRLTSSWKRSSNRDGRSRNRIIVSLSKVRERAAAGTASTNVAVSKRFPLYAMAIGQASEFRTTWFG